MKTTALIGALAVLAATATTVWASDKTTSTKHTKGLVKKAKASPESVLHEEKNVILTGSYIKRDVRRQGVVTDGPNPVYVLDQKKIELTGGADLAQVLIHSGFRR